MSVALRVGAAALPADVILCILDQLVDSASVVISAQVSCAWRYAARSHRLYVYRLRLQRAPTTWQAWRDKLLAAPMPLELSLHLDIISPTDQILWADICRVVALQMPLVNQLDVEVTFSQDLYVFFAAIQDTPAPRLNAFSAVNTSALSGGGHYYCPNTKWFAGSAPRLRDINLAGILLPLSGIHHAVLTHVHSLSIQHSVVNIVQLVTRCPRLKFLALHSCSVTTYASSGSDNSAESRAPLRSLNLNEVIFADAEALQHEWPDALDLRAIPKISCSFLSNCAVARLLLDGIEQHSLSLSIIENFHGSFLTMDMLEADNSSAKAPNQMHRIRSARQPMDDLRFDLIWQHVQMGALTTLKLSQTVVSVVLQSLPSFCLPNVLRLRVECPEIDPMYDFDLNAVLWRGEFLSNIGDVYRENLTRGRVLVPQLQCFEVAIAHDISFATSENEGDEWISNPPYLLSRRELVAFSVRVLGLAPGSETGNCDDRPRPTLRLVNLSWAIAGILCAKMRTVMISRCLAESCGPWRSTVLRSARTRTCIWQGIVKENQATVERMQRLDFSVCTTS